MERLRAAIDKARLERGEEAHQKAPPPAAAADVAIPKPEPKTVHSQENWEKLEEYEVPRNLLERNRIISAAGSAKGRNQSEAISFDKLRTRITQEMRTKGWKRLAITSPGPGCGKSTLSLNLGYTFARLHDERAILCEMDLRRPSLGRLMGLSTRKDFAEVLRWPEVSFADHGIRLAQNFAVGPVRSARSSTSELLQSRGTALAIDGIEQQFDPTIMIFDTAPVLSSDDTMGFLERVDCVLIVAAAGSTTVAEIDRCEREVAANSKVIGVVLNKCRYGNESSKYDYYG